MENQIFEETSSEENCRLRYGLNAHCLLKVFDYLSMADLIEVCKMDVYFKCLTTKWIIEKKTLTFYYPMKPHTVETFQMFGKSMKKLNVVGFDLDFILEMIINYCKPDKLVEIGFYRLKFSEVEESYHLKIIHQSMPYFSNIRSLNFSLCDFPSNELISEFLTNISVVASNINKLEIVYTKMPGGWLKNVQNLCYLKLMHNKNISLPDLTSCLTANNKKLKVFTLDTDHDMTIISKYCPDLTEFSDFNINKNFDQFDALTNRYDFLSTFHHLNAVTLTSYTFCGCDLYYPINSLANKHITELRIVMNLRPIVLSAEQTSKIMQRSLPHFNYLQTVEIVIKKYHDSDSKLTRCDLRFQFIFSFVSRATTLKTFKLCGDEFSNIFTILEFVPHIRKLCIFDATLMYPIVEYLNLVQTLRKIRQSNDDKHMLHLVAKSDVWVYINSTKCKDIMKGIMTISSTPS